MPSVGGTTVLFLKGWPSPKGEVPEDITRPGVNGLAVRQTGERFQPFQLLAKADVADAAAAAVIRTTFYAFKGTLVAITDEYGLSYSNVLIEDVVMMPPKAIRRSIGGLVSGATLMTETRFTCRLTENP